MVKSERFRLAGVPYIHWMAVVAVIALGFVPLTLSLLRLWAVTGITHWEALAKGPPAPWSHGSPPILVL
jgi:hypothetical protein